MLVTLRESQPKVNDQVKRRGGMRWLLETVLWLVGSVVILESLFALAGIGEQEYLMPHPTFGYDPIPSKFVTWRKEGFARLHMNSYGMQDVERSLAKPAGTKRLAVLGDSFVEALQVDRSDNFCSKVERMLNSGSGSRRWEVLNFGVSNASLSQMYLRLKEKVSKFAPDVVAIEFPVDATFQLLADRSGTFLSARPIFHFDGKSLYEDRQMMYVWRNSPEGKRYRLTAWLRANSRIWGVISNCVEQGAGWWQGLVSGRTRWGSELVAGEIAFQSSSQAERGDGGTPAAAQTTPAHLTPSALAATEKRATAYYWPIADGLFKRIKDECDAHKCKLVVVRFSRAQKKDNPEESRLLRETAARYGFSIIDAVPAFSNAIDRHERVFYDSHLNPQGHTVLSEEIFKQAKASRLLD